MANLTLRDIKKNYGGSEILHGINLDIPSGEFVVFVGPSGCGKSTLLRLIAGLEDISSGELFIDDKLMNVVPPDERGISMVFQSYALYPHMTVFDNMAFGLKIAGVKKDIIREKINHIADILQLTPYLDRHPKALSGGQRQRVAIGRAIARDPKVFLFDEPLSNLDAALRVAMRIEIGKLKQSMPSTTMIYVTHDQVEAMTLANRIVVLRDGNIEQIGSPTELYRRPANIFVARFIGSPSMNIFPAKVNVTATAIDLSVDTAKKSLTILDNHTLTASAEINVGIRPEDLRVSSNDDYLLSANVSLVEQLGEVQLVYFRLEGHSDPFIAKVPGNVTINVGDSINLDANQQDIHIFDQDGQAVRT